MDICRRKFGACILAGLTSRAWALPPRPKLLVLVVLEQIRRDYLDALGGQAGPGGLRRLLENGAYFPDCRHLAASYTSSTLATLATGAWPAQHGIVADTWFDRAARKPVRASEEALLATTLAAQLFWMDEQGRFAARGTAPAWLADYSRLKPLENLHNAAWLAAGAAPGTPPLRPLTFHPARPQE